MANINECIPGRQARVLSSGVVRAKRKIGSIVEVSRVKRGASAPLTDRVTVDAPGHGEVVLAPEDIKVMSEK